jgi:antitoxin CptB
MPSEADRGAGQDAPAPLAEQLRWQCRRGMLELDFVLERYLEQHYDAAAEREKRLFRDLLSAQDPELQVWLLNGQRHPDAEVQRLIDRIRGI